jgi:hypothetical protein
VISTTGFRKRILDAIQVRLFPNPVHARHAVYSVVYSEDDAVSGPSARLLDVAAKISPGRRHGHSWYQRQYRDLGDDVIPGCRRLAFNCRRSPESFDWSIFVARKRGKV